MPTLFNKKLISQFDRYPPFRQILHDIKRKEFSLEIVGPKGSFIPFLIGELYRKAAFPSLVIVPTEMEAESIYQDSRVFFEESVTVFPWWDVLPYEETSPLPSMFSLTTLSMISRDLQYMTCLLNM